MTETETINRVPPADLQAEAAVLSASICGGVVSRMMAVVNSTDFYSEAHRQIFAACEALHTKGQDIDGLLVASWLKDAGRLEQVGGMAYVTEVLNAAPSIANAVPYARIVKSKSRRRETIRIAQSIVANGYSENSSDSDYLSSSASALLAATRMPEAEALKDNADTLANIVRSIDRARKTGSTITGIPTGLDRFDRMTLGLHGKQLTVIAARPGQGKTSLGAVIGANVARKGIGVMMFSLEMSREEILFRQLSSIGRIDGTVLRTGGLTPVGWTNLHEAAKTIHGMPFWIDERTGLTVSDMANAALGAMDESKTLKTALGLIIVDYLQKIAMPEKDKRKQRYEQIGDISKGLKQLARDTGMPVIALAQLRRLSKNEKGKRPTMDDLREGGDIEQEADNIVLLTEPEDEQEKKISRDLIIEKARGGRTGIVRVKWVPEYTLFENLPDEYGIGEY
jgi:replicative DNA helicase